MYNREHRNGRDTKTTKHRSGNNGTEVLEQKPQNVKVETNETHKYAK